MRKHAEALWAGAQKLWHWYRQRSVLTLSIVNAAVLLFICMSLAALWISGEPASAQAMGRWGNGRPPGSAVAPQRTSGAPVRTAPGAARSARPPQGDAAIGRREYEVKLRAPRQGAVPGRGTAATQPAERDATRVEGVEDEQPTSMRE